MAIGDGANDVNMIQTAHIGVGILGKEGNQASSFADFAVPRFKDLRRILFWHGRPFGTRLGSAIVFNLVKSEIYCMSVFWVNLFSGFSGHNPVDDFPNAMYNVNMTTFALGFFVVFTSDVANDKYSHSEDLMPFNLSLLYASSRRQQKRIFNSYVCHFAFIWVASCGIFFAFAGH